MKTSIIIPCLILCCNVHILKAQNDSILRIKDSNGTDQRMNSVYFELGGNGGAYSFNYDRLLSFKNNRLVGLGVRIGFTYFEFGFFGATDTYKMIPTEVYVLYGRNKRIETGLGYNFNFGTNNWSDIVFRIGFRAQGRNGLLVRVAPGISYTLDNNELLPAIGIAIGYSF